MTVVFVPVFNVDGHERFGPNQRPNQRGPRQTGFRTTAQNLNLNRDWVKADAPEMAAMLALFDAWDPVMLVDLHVTDGAKFEHDVAAIVAPERSVSPELQQAARALSDQLMAGLGRRGHLPVPFYPHFRKDGDPSSGIDAGSQPAAHVPRLRRLAQSPGHPGRDPQLARLPPPGEDHPGAAGRAAAAGARAGGPLEGRGARGRSRRRRPRRQASGAALAPRGPPAIDRLPGLRLHARAVAALRRQLDALRRAHAPDLEASTCTSA